MAAEWLLLLLIALVQDAATGVFQSDQPRPLESLSEKWPDAKSTCLSKCRCQDENNNLSVDCGFQGFDSLPPDLPLQVGKLQLAGNALRKLNFDSVLVGLELLNVSDNRISEISEGVSRWLPNLRSLDLSKNVLRSGAAENAFKDLVQLSRLDLSHNQLDSVTDPMFVSLASLEYLNLSSCKIERISYDGFYDLTSLGTLDLSYNSLADLRHEWLRNLASLQHLHLRGNSIRFLRNVVFSTLKNLQVLDLSQNNIKSVGLLSFKGLSHLHLLNLSSNSIPHLQEGVFRSLEAVKVVDLSSNPVAVFDNVFAHAKDLEQLYLRDSSRLQALTVASLRGAHNLQVLDLSGSVSLSEIHQEAFQDLKGLALLDLSGGNLTVLHRGVLEALASLTTLRLSDNPWRCDCHLYWLLEWLAEHTRAHLLAPSHTQCRIPGALSGHAVLDALDHSMVCTHALIRNHTTRTRFKVGLPARLECAVDGSPLPHLTWVTPARHTLRPETGKGYLNASSDARFHIGADGGLNISSVQREDGGFYVCVATNPLGRTSAAIRLTLDYSYIVQIKVVSVLVGLATSSGFLLGTLVWVLASALVRRMRWGGRGGEASPRTQHIKKVLESIEHYKRQQLEWLRGNYNLQVQRIKDNCMQQMERLRESYSSQAETLRDFREYGTLQIDRIRDNYYSQVQRVRDYSASQIVRLRENYLCQRNRIRKFSAHHLYKLRENYKVQQQHLNRILENLNIESCRNVCQRTESTTLDPAVALPFPPPLLDPDAASQTSAYFTPDEDAEDCPPPRDAAPSMVIGYKDGPSRVIGYKEDGPTRVIGYREDGPSRVIGYREDGPSRVIGYKEDGPSRVIGYKEDGPSRVPKRRARVYEKAEVHLSCPKQIVDKSTSTSDIRCMEVSDTYCVEVPGRGYAEVVPSDTKCSEPSPSDLKCLASEAKHVEVPLSDTRCVEVSGGSGDVVEGTSTHSAPDLVGNFSIETVV